MKSIALIELDGVPILEQLRLEEALLRTEERSFCVINTGSPRAIVMGLSNKVETLVNVKSAKEENIPLIKRFSGGGTVIVDENTLFVTFIVSKKDFEGALFPEPILKWGEGLFQEAWQIPQFGLRENDYCIGEKKCGGNAQYIMKDRFLQHTSFLWDYREENMRHLLMPARRPQYRLDRPHEEFLTRLRPFGSRKELIARLKEAIVKRLYIVGFDLKSWEQKEHRQATCLVG
jgi:lipoate---protein ligase